MATTLADMFSLEIFHSESSNTVLEKTMIIDERPAYEIKRTGSYPNMEDNVTHAIFIESDKIYVIQLGSTEYDNLTSTLKQIIGSIKFN
jgi:hypothetical protein